MHDKNPFFFFPARAWKRWGEVWLALGQKPGFLGWTGALVCHSVCVSVMPVDFHRSWEQQRKLGQFYPDENAWALLCVPSKCVTVWPTPGILLLQQHSVHFKSEIWDLKAQCCVCCPYLILYDTEIYVKNLNSFIFSGKASPYKLIDQSGEISSFSQAV